MSSSNGLSIFIISNIIIFHCNLDQCPYSDRNWIYNDSTGMCYSNLSLTAANYAGAASQCLEILGSKVIVATSLEELISMLSALKIELRIETIWLGLEFNQGILFYK